MHRKQSKRARRNRQRRGAAKRPARRGAIRALVLLIMRVSLWLIVMYRDDHS